MAHNTEFVLDISFAIARFARILRKNGEMCIGVLTVARYCYRILEVNILCISFLSSSCERYLGKMRELIALERIDL